MPLVESKNAQAFPKSFDITGRQPVDARQTHASYSEALAWANDPANTAFEQMIITALVNGSPKMFILKGHVPTGEDDTQMFDLIDIVEQAKNEAEEALDWETL